MPTIEPKAEKTESDANLKNENNQAIDTEKELKYQMLVKLKKSIRCMPASIDKKVMYQQVAKQFTKLSGYKDSEECAVASKGLAIKTKKEFKKLIYKRAQRKKNEAKLAQDYKSAAEEFRKISGFRDSDDMATTCDQLSTNIEKKAIKKRVINNGIVVLCIIIVILGFTTSHTKYYLANTYMFTKSYNSAIKIYHKLGEYKDSEDRYTQCQYLLGLDSEEEGDFKNAEKAFTAAKNYKDSVDKKVEMEKLIIKNSKIGATVKVGNYEWIILDIKNNQALLMMKIDLPGRAYNAASADVTWEKSTLRSWLNSDFMEEAFSELEQKNIILTNVENGNNSVYGTEGGNNTQDYMFLLSVEEVEIYKSLFPTFKSNSWLRTPGYSQSSAAFLSLNDSVMDYGYVTTSEEITVRPVLWFNID